MSEILELAEDFKNCRKILIALGDENRQHLILEMMKMEKCGGVRVGEITERTHLSRPAVSHHLQILKNAGIISVKHEGTKNYYFFDKKFQSIRCLIDMLERAEKYINALPCTNKK